MGIVNVIIIWFSVAPQQLYIVYSSIVSRSSTHDVFSHSTNKHDST